MKLNLFSPFNTVSYGYVGCYLFQELIKLGVDLAADCIPNKTQFSAEPKFQNIKAYTDSFGSTFHHDAPCLKIWHQHDLRGFTGHGKKIGFPIFELNRFSPEEKHNLEYPDELIVCSEWAKTTVLRETNRTSDTVHVVPLGVDTGLFKPVESNKAATTRFGNFGKWELRKGHDVLIQAFNKAFEPDDDVELIMSPHNFFLTQQQTQDWINYYGSSKLGSKIKIANRQETHEEVYNLMQMVDCGVFPARAEGWNLEILELMACGKEIITTDCTGHTEFCHEANSKLIEMDGMESAVDGVFFQGQGEWYSFGDSQIDQLVEYMRHFHGSQKGVNQAGINTANEFTWTKSAEKIVELLKGQG
jgi:glycosyltransferase involved in cell wall biosynthesis